MSISILSVEINPYKNILLFPTVDGSGWEKGYQKNIVYEYNGPDPTNPTVASFNDATSTNSSGYWYSYGDYAPQESDTDYVIQLWVKVEEGTVNVRPYTGDNNESSTYGSNARVHLEYKPVTAADGWKLLTWSFKTTPTWYSDSLSFQWDGDWGLNDKRMFISAPKMMTKEDYEKTSVYTNDTVLIQVKIEDTPVIFNEMDTNIWDSFSDINTWNEIDQTQN